MAEQWRDRLIDSDDHLGIWLDQFPATDVQQLRTLMRQVRKDDATAIAKAKEAEAKGQILPPAKKGKAYRELFQPCSRTSMAQQPPRSDAEAALVLDDEARRRRLSAPDAVKIGIVSDQRPRQQRACMQTKACPRCKTGSARAMPQPHHLRAAPDCR